MEIFSIESIKIEKFQKNLKYIDSNLASIIIVTGEIMITGLLIKIKTLQIRNIIQ